MAAVGVEISSPPDVRGPTAPMPAATLGAGIASLVIVLGGTLALLAFQGFRNAPLTSFCTGRGIVETGLNPITGARSICGIAEAMRGNAELLILVVGLALGLFAVGVGFTTYRHMDTKRRRNEMLAGAIIGAQAVLLAGFLLWFRQSATLMTFVKNFLDFPIISGWWGKILLTGAKNTALLAFGGEIGGIVIGLILALFTISKQRSLRAPARAYINFFRGTPLVWQLSFMYFGIATGLGLNLDAYTTALIVFSLNTGAYAAEVFRAGIQSIERGQLEAARGLGMSYMQAMRYAVIPQAVRRVIPPLMNEFVILIKDTSLVLVLGLATSQWDLMTAGSNGYLNTYFPSFYIVTAIGYLAISLPLIRLVNAIEKRLRSGLVGVTA
jgi:His/Glu/Gln/Arg/opine family amino acid ABC transporter permease subunit